VSRRFAVAPLPPLANGLSRALVYEEVGHRRVLFATVEHRTTDKRAIISLTRQSGQYPKGTLKNLEGDTVYRESIQSAVETLDILREMGAL